MFETTFINMVRFKINRIPHKDNDIPSKTNFDRKSFQDNMVIYFKYFDKCDNRYWCRMSCHRI